MFRFLLRSSIITLIFIFFPSLGFSLGPKDFIAFWSFDKESGDKLTDDSGNGRDGTLRGPGWAKDGKFGKALSFDGMDDDVDLVPTSATLFDGITQFTITVWANPTHKATTDWPAILQKYQGSSSYDMPWVGYYEAKDQWAWEITTDKAENKYHETGIAVTFDTWSHLAFAIDIRNKVGKFYLNGDMEDEWKIPISGTKMSSNPSGGKITIGSIGYTDGHRWRGLIDELRVWSKILSADEIKQDMKKGKSQLLTVEAKDKLTTIWGSIKIQY